MSDEERATIGREHRDRVQAPPQGVPIHASEPDDFTPVGDVMPLAHDEGARILLVRVWQHTANMEMRLLAALKQTDGGVLRAEVDSVSQRLEQHLAEVREAITDIHGASGTNGKLGELKRRVDGLEADTNRRVDGLSSKAWKILTTMLGGIAVAVTKLVFVVRAFDAVEARALHSEQRVVLLEAQVLQIQQALLTRRYRTAPDPSPPAEPARNP